MIYKFKSIFVRHFFSSHQLINKNKFGNLMNTIDIDFLKKLSIFGKKLSSVLCDYFSCLYSSKLDHALAHL